MFIKVSCIERGTAFLLNVAAIVTISPSFEYMDADETTLGHEGGTWITIDPKYHPLFDFVASITDGAIIVNEPFDEVEAVIAAQMNSSAE